MSDAETLAALAAQVADLRGRVLAGEGWQDRHMGLSGLPERVNELAAALADALRDDGAVSPLAPYWLDLGADDYDAELTALMDWTAAVLVPNFPAYTAAVLKPCWPQHPEALWELATLRAEWRRIYDRKKPELAGALVWLDRWLPGVLSRLAGTMKACNAGQCARAGRTR